MAKKKAAKKGAKKTPTKGAKTTLAKGEKAPAGKAPAGKDRFGTRLGTQAAQINAAVNLVECGTFSAADLAAATNLSAGRCSAQMDWLIEHNRVEQTADGRYKLAGPLKAMGEHTPGG